MQLINLIITLIIKQLFMKLSQKLVLKCAVFAAIIFISSVTHAQKFSPATYKNNVKIGLMNTYFEYDDFNFGVSWEFKVANKQSIQIGLSPKLSKDNYSQTGGLGMLVAYRKYISKNKEGLQGLYFSPNIKYGVETYKNLDGYYDYTNQQNPVYVNKVTTDKTNNFNASFLFGKQWVYKSGFSMDISGGLGIFSSKYSSDLPASANYYSSYYYYRSNRNSSNYGISPNLNLSVGYAF
jgi:hypothetical protein